MTDAPIPTTPERSSGGRTAAAFRGGLATLLIGAVLVAVGLVSTTSSSDQPVCPEGTTLLARYDMVDGVLRGTGGDPSTVTITDGTGTGGSWASTQLVGAVVVKGGPGSATTTIDPSQLAGTFSNERLDAVGGVVPQISNVQFCAPAGFASSMAGTRDGGEASSRSRPWTVTLAARTCPTYTDIFANRNRNNLQESLQDLGPDTNYAPGQVVNPAKEAEAPQSNCSPLTGWKFQWGTGITGKSPSTANLSTVTGANAIATTVASVPELDSAGNNTGRTIEGAVTYTLTSDQVNQADHGSLWVQGGTKAQPLGDGTLSFGALRCATDNYNGDNVEYVRYPTNARHAYCFAYYVAQPPEPVTITVRKQLTERSPGGTTFDFTGDTSFVPEGEFDLHPEGTGGSAEISFVRSADVTWTVTEEVPTGWTLESLKCTTPTSGRTPTIEGTSFAANLAPGDTVTCTYTNDRSPTPTSSSTTEAPTSSTSTTSSTDPGAATSSVPPTTPSAVADEVAIRTVVTSDDAAATNSGVLAFTGGSATPMLALGIVLLLTGATLTAVSWQRRRRNELA